MGGAVAAAEETVLDCRHQNQLRGSMRFSGLAVACAVALLSLSAPSLAEQTQPPASVEGQPAAPQPAEAAPEQAPAQDPDEVICKKLEADTGTRLGKRKECRTRREWDQIAEEAKQNLQKSQSKN
jgi:hypothetical protein